MQNNKETKEHKCEKSINDDLLITDYWKTQWALLIIRAEDNTRKVIPINFCPFCGMKLGED